MPVVTLPDGTSAIVCTRGRRRRTCWFCKDPAAFLCDHPDPGHRSGTCDHPLCGAHAVVVGQDRHHCPTHEETQRSAA